MAPGQCAVVCPASSRTSDFHSGSDSDAFRNSRRRSPKPVITHSGSAFPVVPSTVPRPGQCAVADVDVVAHDDVAVTAIEQVERIVEAGGIPPAYLVDAALAKESMQSGSSAPWSSMATRTDAERVLPGGNFDPVADDTSGFSIMPGGIFDTSKLDPSGNARSSFSDQAAPAVANFSFGSAVRAVTPPMKRM